MDLYKRIAEVLELQSQLLRELSSLLKKLEENEKEKAERFYSIKEAAQLMSVSESTVRRLISSGELKSVKLKGKILIPASALEALKFTSL